ncbi:hypothetical protein FGG78_18810 [Thioclava sp. BHET1]|nr:hypothetical protein FGG78_18810 [Thioclava sp. BHET1]
MLRLAEEGLPQTGLRRSWDKDAMALFALYRRGQLGVDLQTNLIGIDGCAGRFLSLTVSSTGIAKRDEANSPPSRFMLSP